ncbi:PTS fructose transporter subunit IIBC [Malacoplasma penetrans]|uniref:PTS transporter subunit EIIC n=1 Tax=Malacoplasma penetrans TaxID=28227 RepID=UPI001011DC2B|nr:PTS transporter subunit EIIC [Malacoplasma penetrans]RXY96921.1 PTS fructose transporter subunit IIBC [Malacoplasma penetrans]
MYISNLKTFGLVQDVKQDHKVSFKSNKVFAKIGSSFKKTFESLGRLGKALLFPIAVLPIAAILNRLGAQLPNSADTPEFAKFVQTLLSAAGNTVFNNLHILFAVGVGFGLTKDNRGEAALTALVGIILLGLLMSSTGADLPQQIYGKIKFPIDQSLIDAGIVSADATGFQALFGNKYDSILSQNVLNGILSGVFVAWVYNRFNNVELPKVLGFFSGRRLLPVLIILGMMFYGIIYAVIFPRLGWILYQISLGLSSATGNRWSNASISGVYAFLNRLLIPFGLHHIPNTLFWFVLGQAPDASDPSKFVYGDINIFLNGQAQGNNAGTFQSGFFASMMFGLPALVYVFYRNAESKEQKQRVLSTFGPLALVSFLTGITEPIEFAFMFVSPLLYGVHALLTGIFSFITGAMGIQIGFGFSAGLIDYLLSIPKSLQIIEANRTGIDAVFANPGWLWVIGLLCALSYIFVGNLLVKKLNLSVPGRGQNLITESMVKKDNHTDNNKDNKKGLSEKTKKLVLGLGGWENIENYQNCTTRLRYDVKDMSKIDEALLKEGGAIGTKKFQDHHLHVILGPEAELVNDEIINNKNSDLTLNNDNNLVKEKEKQKLALAKPVKVKSPISGTIVFLEDVKDETFSLMGKGVAIIPSENEFIAQDNFEIESFFWTGHAYIAKIKDLDVLVHIGIDTVKINSDKKEGDKLEVFSTKLIDKKNHKISKGEKIIKVDFAKLKKLGYDPTTLFIVLNENLVNNELNLLVKNNQKVNKGDPLFEVKAK